MGFSWLSLFENFCLCGLGEGQTQIKNSSFSASVAKLADALDSKSSEGNFMGVRLSPEAPDFSSKCILIRFEFFSFFSFIRT